MAVGCGLRKRSGVGVKSMMRCKEEARGGGRLLVAVVEDIDKKVSFFLKASFCLDKSQRIKGFRRE